MKTQEEIDEIAHLQLKRARKKAIVFGILAIIALIAVEYAFFQNVKAEKYRIESEMQKEMLLKCEKLSEATEQELVKSIKKLEETMDVMMAMQAAKKSN